MAAVLDLIRVAENEVGYLEKKTNANLNDKTANAGSNNYTKYGLSQGCNGQPWCDAFVDWCFIQAYGKDKAKELLGGFSNYTPTSAQYFKALKSWYISDPKVGDVIFFKNSSRICHTGIVYNLNNETVYTIEGNTSSGNNTVVANGGGVFKKSYKLTNPKIAGYGRPKYDCINNTVQISKYPVLQLGSKGNYVTAWQNYLNGLGYPCGKADGIFGVKTLEALKAYQCDRDLVPDGIINEEDWNSVKLE